MSSRPHVEPPPASFTWRGIMAGARSVASVAPFTVPFGMGFAVAALEAGLRPLETVLMSAVVFAGAAQFASLEFWGPSIALIPLLLAVFAVNGRMLLFGAALYPWLRLRPPWERHVVASLVTDAGWAFAMQAHARGERDIGYLFGSGLVLWTTWQIGTVLGVWLDSAMDDPKSFGIDVVFLCFFAVVLFGQWRGRESALPWGVAALVAVLGQQVLPAGWHILAGALAGGIVGAVLWKPSHAD